MEVELKMLGKSFFLKEEKDLENAVDLVTDEYLKNLELISLAAEEMDKESEVEDNLQEDKLLFVKDVEKLAQSYGIESFCIKFGDDDDNFNFDEEEENDDDDSEEFDIDPDEGINDSYAQFLGYTDKIIELIKEKREKVKEAYDKYNASSNCKK